MVVSFLIAEITKDGEVLPMLLTGADFGAALSVPFVILTGLLKISGLFAIVLFILLSPLLGFIITYIFSLVFIRWFRNADAKKMNFLSKKTPDFFSLILQHRAWQQRCTERDGSNYGNPGCRRAFH